MTVVDAVYDVVLGAGELETTRNAAYALEALRCRNH